MFLGLNLIWEISQSNVHFKCRKWTLYVSILYYKKISSWLSSKTSKLCHYRNSANKSSSPKHIAVLIFTPFADVCQYWGIWGIYQSLIICSLIELNRHKLNRFDCIWRHYFLSK